MGACSSRLVQMQNKIIGRPRDQLASDDLMRARQARNSDAAKPLLTEWLAKAMTLKSQKASKKKRGGVPPKTLCGERAFDHRRRSPKRASRSPSREKSRPPTQAVGRRSAPGSSQGQQARCWKTWTGITHSTEGQCNGTFFERPGS